MDVLHLVTLNNTIININSKQITEYSISTTQSILSIPYIHIFQGNGIAVHTLGTFKVTFDTFKSTFPHVYQVILPSSWVQMTVSQSYIIFLSSGNSGWSP